MLFYFFPAFHIVHRPAGDAAMYDAAAFAEEFWKDTLQPAAARASRLAPILAAIREDPVAAAQRHGRKVGAGTTWYYFARGAGRVVAVERSRLLVEVDGASGATVAVRTGPVFGNVLRDGCGLLELNGVPGLTEFNALSAALNHLVEERVQPPLRAGVAVGAHLTFAGCTEAPESVGDGPLLVIVPVQAEIVP